MADQFAASNSTCRTLPELHPAQRPIRQAAILHLRSNPQDIINQYRQRFRNIFNADDAAELFPDYAASKESRAAYRTDVHPAAQWVRDESFAQALKEAPDASVVIFTAGGTASTKSTAARGYARFGNLILDSILGGYDSAVNEIETVRSTGHPVVIKYVYRDPIEAFHAAIRRSMEQGRMVPAGVHAKAHSDARDTAIRLAETYANDPQVLIHLQAFSPDGRLPLPIDELRAANYAGLSDQLKRIIDERAGSLPQYVIDGAREGQP